MFLDLTAPPIDYRSTVKNLRLYSVPRHVVVMPFDPIIELLDMSRIWRMFTDWWLNHRPNLENRSQIESFPEVGIKRKSIESTIYFILCS